MPSEMSKRREHKINKLSKEVYKDKTPPASKESSAFHKLRKQLEKDGLLGKPFDLEKDNIDPVNHREILEEWADDLKSIARMLGIWGSICKCCEVGVFRDGPFARGKAEGRQEVLKAMKKYFGLACHHDRDFMICPLCLKEFIKQEGGSDERGEG